nr:hypothetical protein [Tanacetum cinerariifolium]
METTIEQQVAMDEALVPSAQRLRIERINFRLLSDIQSKESTLQLVYDVLRRCPFCKAFLVTSDEILDFIRFLEHSATKRTLTDVNINKLYQPWRSFAAIINKCLTGKTSGYDSLRLSQAQILWGLYHKRNVDYAFLIWEDFVFQVEHKNQKKSNEMPKWKGFCWEMMVEGSRRWMKYPPELYVITSMVLVQYNFDTLADSPPEDYVVTTAADPIKSKIPHCSCCEFCGNGAHVGYNCPAQVLSFQTLPSFPQQYPCCEDCVVLPEADYCQPPQYTVNHPIFNAHNDLFGSRTTLMEQMEQLTSMCEIFCQFIQKKQEEKRIEEEQTAKGQNSKIPVCYDDDDDYNYAITPNEPVDSLSIGDEHLDTIPATKSDKFIKSSVENLVPNPNESEGENGCDFPACFTTFLNILFDANYESDSSDYQSCSDEDFLEENFSNPLFEEEINSMRIDQHHFNVESNLIESMLNPNSSIIPSSSKIDSLLEEFAGELTLLKLISPRIDETDCHPENEIRFIERLLYDNSSPRPPKEFVFENSDAEIKSFSPSPIPVEDSNSFMEEIDLFLKPDDPMPPGIEEDDDDSERDILILEEFPSNYSLSLPEIESFYFDIPSFFRPPAKPPDGNTGLLNIKMMGDVSNQKVHIPGLTITHVSNQENSPDLLSHRGLEIFKLSAKCSMMIHGKNIPILDVPVFHFYPLDQLKYGGNWVKLSDLKQALRGRHHMLITSLVFLFSS